MIANNTKWLGMIQNGWNNTKWLGIIQNGWELYNYTKWQKNKSQADSSLVAQLKIILEPHEKTWSRKLDTTFDSKQ